MRKYNMYMYSGIYACVCVCMYVKHTIFRKHNQQSRNVIPKVQNVGRTIYLRQVNQCSASTYHDSTPLYRNPL